MLTGEAHQEILASLLLGFGLAPWRDLGIVDEQGRDALLLAAEDGSLASVEALLAAGANPNRRAANGQTSLGRAVIGAHLHIAARLLAAGSDANAAAANGQTPLIIAVRTGNRALVETLVAAGADVNRVESSNGNSALMYAANSGFADLVDLLLAPGADVNASASDGWTALQAAEMVGETGIMRRLRAASRGG